MSDRTYVRTYVRKKHSQVRTSIRTYVRKKGSKVCQKKGGGDGGVLTKAERAARVHNKAERAARFYFIIFNFKIRHWHSRARSASPDIPWA